MRDPHLDDGDVRLYQGDALEVLREMSSESVQMIVTSPPFWGLRDYGVDGQIGLEETPDEWCAKLVAVMREARRVLRNDGVCWIEIGTSFYGGPENRFKFTATEAAYLAGIIDGEGCIQVHRQERVGSVASFQVDVSVAMKPLEVVEWCHQTTGIGSLNARDRGEKYGINWDWSVRGAQAADLLRTLYPYLRLKRRQAALVIELAGDIVTQRGHRVRPISDEVVEWRQEIRQAVSNLNNYREPGRAILEPKAAPPLGLKAKDDVMAPAMLALALRADGWYVRSEVTWSRPNPMPESVTDRPTKSSSSVFLLSKSRTYHYDADAIREPLMESTLERGYTASKLEHGRGQKAAANGDRNDVGEGWSVPAGRNARSVWVIPTQPTPWAHFATFPEALVERCVKAGTSEHGACGECGAPWRRITRTSDEYRALLVERYRPEGIGSFLRDARERCGKRQSDVAELFPSKTGGITGCVSNWERGTHLPTPEQWTTLQAALGFSNEMNTAIDAWHEYEHRGGWDGAEWGVKAKRIAATRSAATIGWEPSCKGAYHSGYRVPCVVLDPFMGSGTTALVARRLGRHAIGIELSAEYLAIAAERLRQPTLWSNPEPRGLGASPSPNTNKETT